MRLSTWARKNGISYQTAWNWFSASEMFVPARQTPTGTILVDEDTAVEGTAALYAQVSSYDQKPDLDWQVARLGAFATTQGLVVGTVVTEVDSGMNGSRPRLPKLLRSPDTSVIVEWPKLIRFVDDGRYRLDNDVRKNAIRPLRVGMRNGHFADAVAGAQAGANLYSLLQTCLVNGIDAWRHLRALLIAPPSVTTVDDYAALLPWRIDLAAR